MKIALKFFKVIGLPTEPVANSVYYVIDEENEVTAMWVTDNDGQAFPLGGNGVGVEVTIPITTEALADGAIEVGTVEIARSFRLKRIIADKYTEIRLYGDAAARTDDAAREFGDNSFIGSESRLIASLLLDTEEALSWRCSPPALGQNTDDPTSPTIYYSIKNLSGSTTPITITLKVLIEEI